MISFVVSISGTCLAFPVDFQGDVRFSFRGGYGMASRVSPVTFCPVFSTVPGEQLTGGQFDVGYHYNSPAVKIGGYYSGSQTVGAYSLAAGINNRLIVGGCGTDGRVTDIFTQYDFPHGSFILLGRRHFDTRFLLYKVLPSEHTILDEQNTGYKMFYGAGASLPLGGKLSGQVFYAGNTVFNEWSTGLSYRLTKTVQLNVSYQYYLEHLSSLDITMKGLSTSLNYKF